MQTRKSTPLPRTNTRPSTSTGPSTSTEQNAAVRSTKPHIALRKNVAAEGETPRYERAGTISYGQKEYSLNILLGEVSPGDSLVGYAQNEFDLSRIGKGVRVSYCDKDGNWSESLGFLRVTTINAYTFENGVKSKERVPTQVVVLRLNEDAALPLENDGRVARLSAINHVLRQAQHTASS